MSGAVIVFDSGVGGLPYLESIRRYAAGERFIYLADRGGFPYGLKTGDEVRERVLRVLGRLLELEKPRALVIACNTASQSALAALRKTYPALCIVGTVPAVKPAAAKSRSGIIGLMATARTVADPYLDELVARYAKDVKTIRVAAQELVAFVERELATSTEESRRRAVLPHVRSLLEAGADTIVLACTHFLHLSPDIALAAGPGVEVVDSREGVARRLAQLLSAHERQDPASERVCSRDGSMRSAASEEGALFLLTGEPPIEAHYAYFAERFDLSAPRLFEVP